MLKITILLLLQVINFISSDHIENTCILKNDISSPKFIINKSYYRRYYNNFQTVNEEVNECILGEQATLSCGSGIFHQSLFPVHEVTGICQADHILDPYGYKIFYCDLECDFNSVMNVKQISNTVNCPEPLNLFVFGFIRRLYQPTSLLYEMCFNRTTMKANYIRGKISYKIDTNDTNYNYKYEVLANETSIYFDSTTEPIESIDKSIIMQEFKSIMDKKGDFGYNIEPLFEIQDIYFGLFNKSQSQYLWSLIKHEKVGYATVNLIDGNVTEEYLCKTQIPSNVIEENVQKSFNYQLCKYDDLRQTIPEMPIFKERVRFMAGTDFP